MLPKKLKRIVLVFVGLITAVLIIEGLLRFVGWSFLYLQERQNKAPILSTNAQQNQAGDTRLNRIEGNEIIILCIGESTTAFFFENSWPSQLQRILNNLQDEKTFRVINKGIPSITTNEVSTNLPKYLDEYKPHFVLGMLGINDKEGWGFEYVEEEAGKEEEVGKAPLDQSRWITLAHHFRTYDLIKWIATGIKTRITEETESVAPANVGEKNDNEEKLRVYNLVHPNVTHLHPQTIRNLNDMVNLTKDRGVNFVFVQYALRKIDILKNVIERDVFYISNYEIITDLLTQYSYDDLFTDAVGGNFGHATTFGNRIIADNVARHLLNLLNSQE